MRIAFTTLLVATSYAYRVAPVDPPCDHTDKTIMHITKVVDMDTGELVNDNILLEIGQVYKGDEV